MNFTERLTEIVALGASDVFIVAGRPLSYKLNGTMHTVDDKRLMPGDTDEIIREIYRMANDRSTAALLQKGDDDFSFSIKGISRFRVSTYKQRGSLAAVVRIIQFTMPDPKELHIPDKVIRLADFTKGLVLVTGPAGSGKSSTLACMIDYINNTRENHIITLEDPLEYLHSHNKSIVSQREINSDTESYLTALRATLRQSPDVILLGEMRDYETISVTLTAAETGHLIFSTLHTIGAANTIDRIIDVFPADQQRQIAVQLSSVLRAVVSEQLVPSVDGRLVPAFEIMMMNTAVRNMIRDGKIHQIDGIIYSSPGNEMQSMDASLLGLYKDGIISRDTALTYASNPDMLTKKL
ncbi:PilT/PilU family type 4a pilus ATPase [Anaerolentibacter hominis]|uniref:type IV pilus twitching motility protein PilT n=1 Tax=Anaerolentibacter hominis TaxID=3079009 RepID=UPI0031B7F1C6